MKAYLLSVWRSVTRPPYPNLPWVIWAYVVLCAIIPVDQPGVFSGHVIGFDDQVRMTQVLNWINGAGWYDRTITRVNAPDGFTTIWSRIVDIPIAAIVLAAQQFVSQKNAALVAATIMPLIELALLFVAAPYFARPLLGKNKARLIVLFIMFSSILNHKYFSISGFLVGQASHHPWYVILDLLMFGAAARLAMGVATRAPVIMLASAITLLTTVGIEGYPMIAGAAAMIALTAWIDNRAVVARRGAIAFAGAALAGLLLVPMHQPPQRFLHVSFAEPSILGPVLVVSAALYLALVQALIRRFAPNRLHTAILASLAAAVIAAGLIHVFPDLLHGGAAGLSAAERKMALQGHPEGMPLHIVARTVVGYVGLATPIALALGAGIFALSQAQGRRRIVALCYLGFAVIAGGMSEFYARYYHHAMTTSSAWLVWLWERIKQKLPHNEDHRLIMVLSFIALGPFWMLLLPAIVEDEPVASRVLLFPSIKPDLCDPLGVAGYIDAHYDPNTLLNVAWQSSEFLYYTHVRVDFLANYPSQDKFIDNYHFFGTRDPEQARAIAARHGFDLVAVCRYPALAMGGMPDRMQTMVALLQMGHPPFWLRQVPMQGVPTNYLLYEVDKKAVFNPGPAKPLATAR